MLTFMLLLLLSERKKYILHNFSGLYRTLTVVVVIVVVIVVIVINGRNDVDNGVKQCHSEG